MAQRLPLDTLSELARNKADDSAKRLGVLQRADLTAKQKLQLLVEYREDYQRQLQVRMTEGVATAHVRNHQAFLTTLDGAIEQQRAIVEQAAGRLDVGRRDWQDHKRRQNSFDTLSERTRRQEMLIQAKREQRDSDERSTRRFIDKTARSAI